jgi:hypothetical protein
MFLRGFSAGTPGKFRNNTSAQETRRLNLQHLGESAFIPPLFPSFNAAIQSLRATLPGEIFYWGFFFLNRAIR